MTIDWTPLIAKKQQLAKELPNPAQLRRWELAAARVLGVSAQDAASNWGVCLGYGMRTLALVATNDAVSHRFERQTGQAVAKLYRGPARDFLAFHGEHFSRVPIFSDSNHLQQSITSGVLPDGFAYSVLEFIPGSTLRDAIASRSWSVHQVCAVLQDLFTEIWIPIWHRGLRFKDCHLGNYVLRESDGSLAMIDCEQMRKSTAEWLAPTNDWTCRERHERAALSRLPQLIITLASAAGTTLGQAAVRRVVLQALSESKLPECLSRLGRDDKRTMFEADAASRRVVELLKASPLWSASAKSHQ